MNHNLKTRFLEFCLKKELFRAGERVLVAVSGGQDSSVLLHLLDSSKSRLDIEIAVVHLNHLIRGTEAKKDEEFVAQLAEKLNLSCTILHADVKRIAREEKLSLEEAGHRMRDILFEELAERENFQRIVTAHHLDDQAETILMRLLSGTGLQGLAGIRMIRGKWIRPLLFATRNEISAYAQSQQIPFRYDRSNENMNFLRNKIRQHLLPILADDYNVNIKRHLSHLSAVLAEWDEYVQTEVEIIYDKHVIGTSGNKIKVELRTFKLYFSWLLVKLIEKIFEDLSGQEIKISHRQFTDFGYWIKRSRRGGEFNWGANVKSFKRKDSVDFIVETEHTGRALRREIYPDKDYLISENHYFLRLTRVDVSEIQFNNQPETEYLDGSGFQFPLILRSWKAGDRFIPLGLAEEKRVSVYLTDKKIGLPEKKRIKLLENKEEVVAILTIQIDNRYRVRNDSEIIYCLHIKRLS